MYFFWSLSGGDITIIRLCNARTQALFKWLGVFVFLVMTSVFLCFLAATLYFFDVIEPTDTENEMGGSLSYFIEPHYSGIIPAFLVAGLMTFIFWNIYLLTITTFSKNVLPIKSAPTSRIFSILLRLSFIIFFAVLLSKPAEVLILQNNATLQESVRAHKLEAIAKATKQNSPNSLDNGPVETDKIREIISKSNFFLLKIKLISTSKTFGWTWLISAVFVLIFLLPVIVKWSIRSDSDYYLRLRTIQIDIITRNYNEFKLHYTHLFVSSFNNDVHFYETYEDPPFNTVKKTDTRKFRKQEDFLNMFKSNAEL